MQNLNRKKGNKLCHGTNEIFCLYHFVTNEETEFSFVEFIPDHVISESRVVLTRDTEGSVLSVLTISYHFLRFHRYQIEKIPVGGESRDLYAPRVTRPLSLPVPRKISIQLSSYVTRFLVLDRGRSQACE